MERRQVHSRKDNVRPSSPQRRQVPPRVVLALLVGSFLAIGLQAAITHPFDPDKACCDHLFYRSMAYNYFSVTRPELDRPPPGNRLWTLYRPTSPQYVSWLDIRNGLRRQPPYCYRFVTPLVARGIAFLTSDIDAAFYFISFVALTGAGLFLALSVYVLVGRPLLAALAIALFAASPWVTTFNLSDYMLTDPAAFLLTTIAIYALIRRNRVLFFAACLVGVFDKETLVPMLVSYPLSEGLLERRVHASTILAALGITGLWLLYRGLLPIPVDRYSFTNEFRFTVGQMKGFLIAAAGTFGVLAIASWRILAAPVLLALIPFALAQVAGGWYVGNIERALVQAFPVVILAVLAVWPLSFVARVLVIAPVAAQFLLEGLHDSLGAPYQIVLPPMLFIVTCLEIALVIRIYPDVRGALSHSTGSRAN